MTLHKNTLDYAIQRLTYLIKKLTGHHDKGYFYPSDVIREITEIKQILAHAARTPCECECPLNDI